MDKFAELRDKIAHTDKMIKFYEGQKLALLLELKLSCSHMEVIARKTLDYDRWDYEVTCNDCGSVLFSGNKWQYEEWKKHYNNGELTEVG